MCGGTYWTVDEDGNEVLKRDYSHFIIGGVVLVVLLVLGITVRALWSTDSGVDVAVPEGEVTRTTGLDSSKSFDEVRAEMEKGTKTVVVDGEERKVFENSVTPVPPEIIVPDNN